MQSTHSLAYFDACPPYLQNWINGASRRSSGAISRSVVQLRGRSQLSTFMKAYTAYARGEGVWDHRTLFPRKSTFIFYHWQCIIKYCTCLECGQYAHLCRSFMYNNTFEALFLTSKCTKKGFLWTQTVAPHRGFCKAAQRRYRIFSTWADSTSQNRTKLRIFH